MEVGVDRENTPEVITRYCGDQATAGSDLSSSIDSIHCETRVGSDGSVFSEALTVKAVGLNPEVSPVDQRSALMAAGIPLDAGRVTNFFNIASGGGSAVRFDADQKQVIKVCTDVDQIAHFRLAQWAQGRFDTFSISKSKGYRADTTHGIGFKSGEAIGFDVVDGDTVYSGTARSGIDQSSTVGIGAHAYARQCQVSLSDVGVCTRIAEDVVHHLPSSMPAPQTLIDAVQGRLSEKLAEITGEVQQELDGKCLLPNVVSVLSAAGALDIQEANAIINHAVETQGARIAEDRLEPTDLLRLKARSYDVYTPADKVGIGVDLGLKEFHISSIDACYYAGVSEEDSDKHCGHYFTDVRVPSGHVSRFRDALPQGLTLEEASWTEIEDSAPKQDGKHVWNELGQCFTIEGDVMEVTQRLASAGLMPQAYVDDLQNRFDAQVAEFDRKHPEFAAPKDTDLSPAAPGA